MWNRGWADRGSAGSGEGHMAYVRAGYETRSVWLTIRACGYFTSSLWRCHPIGMKRGGVVALTVVPFAASRPKAADPIANA